jgi:hypothetical protein
MSERQRAWDELDEAIDRLNTALLDVISPLVIPILDWLIQVIRRVA